LASGGAQDRPTSSRRSGIVLAIACVLGATTASAQPSDPMPPEPSDPMPPEVDAGAAAPDLATGSADPDVAPGLADPGAGSADPGAGSADPFAGSAADPYAGSGAQIIQLPTDLSAPQVTAAASPTVVQLGGRFTVIIRATYGEGVEVNLREPVDLGSVFEVRRKLSEDKQVSDGRTTREWQIEVTPWELGDLVMPPISVTYTSSGKAGQVQTNRVRLKIIGVLGDVVDDPAMRGHAPPADLVARDWFWLWVGGAAGAVVGAAIGLWWYRRRRRRRVTSLVAGVVGRPRRMDMTSERALERLLAIEQAGVLDRDDDRKAGYLEMVEVVRDYVGARYRIHATELTSSELLHRLARAAPPEEVALVGGWLEQCELVKYGGLRATRDQAHGTLDDARALIVTTTDLATGGRPGSRPAREAA
jgi:hypothetical protein